jgi:DNA-binding transcriptional regulator YiaG
MLPVHNRGEDEIMTNDEIVERAKRLYTIIVNRELGDDEDSVCKRVCIVRELEAITHKDFRNTAEFHREVSAFLVRKSRIKETDGGRLRRARKRAKLTIKALAVELGVTERTVIRWEKNDGPPLSTRAVEWLNRQNISTGEKVTLVSERV